MKNEVSQLKHRVIYSSSRNDLPDHNYSFDVGSTDDGSLLFMFKDNVNQYKFIHALLPNGSTTDIDLNFLDKNITLIFPLNMQYYFLVYDQKFNGNMQVTGMVLDYNKQIVKDNLFVAKGNIDKIEKLELIMDTRSTSFLIYNINKANDTLIHWIMYNLLQLSDLNIYAKNNGSFNLNNDNFSLKTVFPMINGNYGFIIEVQRYATVLNNSMTNTFIYYRYLYPISGKLSKRSLIYHARNISEISNVSCSSDYSENGNVCTITEPTVTFGNNTLFTTYRINFLSSGSVIEFKHIKNNTYNNNYDIEFDIYPSFFGGSIITSWVSISLKLKMKVPVFIPPDPSKNYTDMTGSVILLNDTEIRWNLAQLNKYNQSTQSQDPLKKNQLIFQSAMFNLMKNNTYILYVRYSADEWDIYSIDLPKSRNDNGYDNPNIISTFPKTNNNSIIPENIHHIRITFSSNISMSLNNLTIYHLDSSTNKLNLRKFYSGNSECNILFNNSLSCNVTSSIFNQWNATYIIVMDNNFVMFSSTNEPMYGIEEYRWNFTTIPCPQSNKEYADTAIGTIRLILGDDIKNDSISDIANNVTKELADSIPISSDRLQQTNRYQSDLSAKSPRYIIQLKILSTTDPCQATVSQVIDYLNELIKDENTIIYQNNYTKYLSSSHGFKVNVMDILFIANNGKDVSQLDLYYSSIAILVISIAFNLVSTITFIMYELKTNTPFIQWFSKNESVVPFFTIISGANVVLLEFLTSNFAGFLMFNAPYSKSVKQWIFRATIINTFIENIPQFVIQ
ncbi:1766_t:CDS:2, partial [Gigaspora rosea]